LLQVKLQANNPGKEKTIGSINDFDITHTCRFSNDLPVTKSGTMVQTKGTGNEQTLHFVTRFTDY
jgi:hypothetical protein